MRGRGGGGGLGGGGGGGFQLTLRYESTQCILSWFTVCFFCLMSDVLCKYEAGSENHRINLLITQPSTLFVP